MVFEKVKQYFSDLRDSFNYDSTTESIRNRILQLRNEGYYSTEASQIRIEDMSHLFEQGQGLEDGL